MARSRISTKDAWIPAEVGRNESVLVEGATAEQIRAAEARLGVRLPRSYVDFLLISNGAYANDGLQLDAGRRPAADGRRSEPIALLPIEEVAWATHALPSFVEDMVSFDESLAPGRSTGFDGPMVDQLALTSSFELCWGHLLYALHIGGDGDPFVFLDPLSVDAHGEWEVFTVGAGAVSNRAPSFTRWIEIEAEAVEHRFVTAPGPEQYGALPTYFDLLHDPDLANLATKVEAVLGDGAQTPGLRAWAFGLLGAVDDRDGGVRQKTWVERLLHDPAMVDLDLVGPMIRRELTGGGLPTLAEVTRLDRPGDREGLATAPSSVIARLADELGVDAMADELVRRALPPFDDRANVELVTRLHSGHLDRPVTLRRSEPIRDVSADDVILAGDRLLLLPGQLIRALLLAGYLDEAYEMAAARVEHSHDLVFLLAEMDSPKAWSKLDELVGERFPLSWMALGAAAHGGSPLLVRRAVDLLGSWNHELERFAIRALEGHRSQEAIEALLRQWQRGSLDALRALARRRISTISPACEAMLTGEDRDERLVAAAALRDLRDPATAPALLGVLESWSGDDDLLLTVAHALATMQVVSARKSFVEIADEHADSRVALLLTTWADQLAGLDADQN